MYSLVWRILMIFANLFEFSNIPGMYRVIKFLNSFLNTPPIIKYFQKIRFNFNKPYIPPPSFPNSLCLFLMKKEKNILFFIQYFSFMKRVHRKKKSFLTVESHWIPRTEVQFKSSKMNKCAFHFISILTMKEKFT